MMICWIHCLRTQGYHSYTKHIVVKRKCLTSGLIKLDPMLSTSRPIGISAFSSLQITLKEKEFRSRLFHTVFAKTAWVETFNPWKATVFSSQKASRANYFKSREFMKQCYSNIISFLQGVGGSKETISWKGFSISLDRFFFTRQIFWRYWIR